MSKRIKPLGLDRLKPVVVVVEVILGGLFLAWATALISHYIANAQAVPSAEVESLARTLVVVLLMGVVLFLDGLRRGRRWL